MKAFKRKENNTKKKKNSTDQSLRPITQDYERVLQLRLHSQQCHREPAHDISLVTLLFVDPSRDSVEYFAS